MPKLRQFETPLNHGKNHRGDLRVSFHWDRINREATIMQMRFFPAQRGAADPVDFTWFIQEYCPGLYEKLQEMAEHCATSKPQPEHDYTMEMQDKY
jgi:hypothetical protein